MYKCNNIRNGVQIAFVLAVHLISWNFYIYLPILSQILAISIKNLRPHKNKNQNIPR